MERTTSAHLMKIRDAGAGLDDGSTCGANMNESDKISVRFEVIAGAYAMRALLPFVGMRNIVNYFAIPMIGGLLCSAIALVATVGILRTGPMWARIIATLLALPPLLFLTIMVWGMLGDVTLFNLMTYQ